MIQFRNRRTAFAPSILFLAAVGLTAQTPGNVISLSPTSLTFTTPQGTATTSQQITVTSSGGPAAFTTSVFPTVSWLTISPPAGTTPQALSISASPGALSPGTYATFVTITGTGTNNSTTFPVVLNVTSGPPTAGLSVNPNSLSFSFQTGATAPVTQRLQVTSNSPQSGVAITSIQGASGNWLSVNPTTTVLAPGTPSPVDVTVNPSGLTAGLYNAVVAINPPGTTGVAIPVTVTVSSPAAINIAPQQLNFFYQTGTANPVPQTLNISSASGSQVSFTAAASTTSCGANWLIVTPQSSATPSPLSIQINPSGLQAGNCAGQITITAPGSSTPTQTIPVNLTVTTNPLLQVPTTGPTFTYLLNSNAQVPTQNVQILSSGTPITFTATATPISGGASFLTVNSSSTTTPGSVALVVNPQVLTTLAPGTYTENVTITAAGAGNTPQTFPVTLVISNNPILNVSQQSLVFNYQIGKSAPPSQVLTLTSTGTPLNFTASAASNNCNNFLTVTPTSGMTMGVPGQTGQIVVTANTTGLTTPTTCTGTITLTSPNSTTGPVVLPVTLNVSSNPQITTSLPVINVTALAGANTISQQLVALTSTDQTTALNFTATATTNPTGLSWLAVAPNTGSTPANMTVIINPANLQPGTYTGSINITSTTANVLPQSIPVVLTVVSGYITAAPTTLSFTQPVGGQAPASQTIAIANLPQGTTVSASASTITGSTNWLSASAGPNGVVTVTANGANLSQGVYQGVVTIIAPGTTPSPLYVPVTFTVGSPQTLTFSSGAVGLNFTQGSSTVPGTQQVQVTTNGNPVPINVAFTAGTGGNFVTVTPASGTTPGPITITPNQAVIGALGPGTYAGSLTVSSPSIPNGAQTIPITLVVAPQGPPIVSLVVNAASNQPGAIAPGEIITIYGNGVGPATPYFLTLYPDGTVATSANDLQVTFDGVAAPITFANSTQINAVVPYEIAGHATATLLVKRSTGTSNPIQLQVANAAPAIFSLSQGGSGQGAILNFDYKVNGPANPAEKGSTVLVYATGAGQLNPGGKTGSVNPSSAPFPTPVGTVTATVGGVPAQVTFAGGAPGFVSGALQVNVVIPQNVPSGNQTVVLTVANTSGQGSFSSLPNITVYVK